MLQPLSLIRLLTYNRPVMVTYDQICTAIIKSTMKSLGKESALEPARKAGLQVDNDGNATGASKDILDKLLNEYVSVSGRVGIIFARSAIAALIKGENIDLPESLK